MSQFDDARIAELREIFGKEDFALVVEAFLEEAGQAVATLADMTGSDPDPVREWVERRHTELATRRSRRAWKGSKNVPCSRR